MKKLLIIFGLLLSLTGYSQEILSDSTTRPTRASRRVLSDVGDGVLNALEKTGNSQVYGTRSFRNCSELRQMSGLRAGVAYKLEESGKEGEFKVAQGNTAGWVDDGAVRMKTKDNKWLVRKFTGPVRLEWYSPTGVGNETAKILAALAVGREVVIPNDVTINTTGLTVPDGKTIRGGKIKAVDNFSGTAVVVLGNNTTLDGVEIDGNAENQTTNISGVFMTGKVNTRVINSTIHDVTLKGVYVYGGTNTTVDGNTIYNVFTKAAGSGTNFESVGVCFEARRLAPGFRRVSNNYIYKVGLLGIDCRNLATFVTVEGNQITQIGQPGRSAIGIQVYNTSMYAIVRNNYIALDPYNDSNNQWPISLDKAHSSLLEGNVCTVSNPQSQYGIEIVATWGLKVIGNHVLNTADSMVTTYTGFIINKSSNGIYEANTVYGNGKGHGFRIRGNGAFGTSYDDYYDASKTTQLGCWNNQFNGNTVANVQIGYYVDSWSRHTQINGGDIEANVAAVNIISGEGQINGGSFRTTGTGSRATGTAAIFMQHTNANYPVSNWLISNVKLFSGNIALILQSTISKVFLKNSQVFATTFADNIGTQDQIYIEGNDLSNLTNIKNFGTVSSWFFGPNVGVSGGNYGAGTTAQRPSLTSKEAGATRYNTTTGKPEYYSGTAWSSDFSSSVVYTTAGDSAYVIPQGSSTFYSTAVLTADRILTLPSATTYEGKDLYLVYRNDATTSVYYRTSPVIYRADGSFTNTILPNTHLHLKAVGGTWRIITQYRGPIYTQVEADGKFQTLANLSTSVSLGTSNTLYPSQNAVKAYVDAKKAAASADAATAVGATYSQTEVQAILNELRDLKAKLRTAGLLTN